ncbi:transglycosylase domain-containing protein [Bacillus massilinigeriensis]|uniref:transglycosylase domain-containing protein n=1 Tax=Bacillus mediterraneensis TaxID=1805474 RepID=UPI0008F8EAAB|nr:PBP1A family penicillin-binding protein [Bacillus mediterraneensis]
MEIITNQRFKRTKKYLRAILFIAGGAVALAALLYFSMIGYAKLLGPPQLAVTQSTLYLADNGTVIGESNNGQKRYWVPLKDISPALIEAAIAIEDKKFYSHNGLDYKRIAGAALADLRAMAKVQGASTITQQYARNLYLGHDKTWKRKLSEAFYTLRLESNYSKNEILEGYLNTIYYGNGAYGVQAASRYYFGKDAKDLNLAESAMLAGIPKGPGLYSPLVSKERAEARQATVLKAMENNGYISATERKKAEAKTLKFLGKEENPHLGIAPYFQDAVKNALKNRMKFDERALALGGLKIYTTLNLKQQKIAEEVINQGISKDSDIQAGFIAMDPKTGHVKAMIGGRDYKASPFNRSVQAVRQPGSTLKPILYYAALKQGFTPVTMMKSELTTFRFEDGRQPYTPHNFNNKYADKEITMAQALALSDNIYAVKTHLFLGEKELIETAKEFGLTTPMEKVPSLALGTSGVKVIEMAGAYSMLANGGRKVEPVLIERIENHNGEVIYDHNEEAKTALNPELTSVMTHMMTGMFDRKLDGYTSVTGRSMAKIKSRPYAGKSGTTGTDSWMIGYTPQLVTAVWTGYDKGKPLELSTEQVYSKNIWFQFMERALDGKSAEKFKREKGTVGVKVDPETGKLAGPGCPVSRMTYFVEGTEPTEQCTAHLEKEHRGKKEEKHRPKKKEEKDFPWYKKWLHH